MSTLGPGGADWEDIYAGDGTDTQPFDHQLLADALCLKPGTALDLGCGGGGNAIGLARRGWIATGIDASSRAIRSARISAGRARVDAEFLVADFTTWRPDRLYDLVINLFSLPPPGPPRDALLAMAGQALAPGGLLVVGEWERTDTHTDSYVTVDELAGALSHLDTIRAGRVDADPDTHRTEAGSRSWPAALVTARRPA